MRKLSRYDKFVLVAVPVCIIIMLLSPRLGG